MGETQCLNTSFIHCGWLITEKYSFFYFFDGLVTLNWSLYTVPGRELRYVLDIANIDKMRPLLKFIGIVNAYALFLENYMILSQIDQLCSDFGLSFKYRRLNTFISI